MLYVRKNALQILIPKYGLECTLYLQSKGVATSIFHYDEEVLCYYKKAQNVITISFFRIKLRVVGM